MVDGVEAAKEVTVAGEASDLEAAIKEAHRQMDGFFPCTADGEKGIDAGGVLPTLARCREGMNELNRRLEGLLRQVGGCL